MDVASTATAKVLFVDDEPAILSALRRLMRPMGYEVLLAESGAAGLELLAREPVDLVVSDMRMPGMDGAQFLEQVRQRWPAVQRMLLTGYADIGSTIAAINRGEIHRYIAKPWDDQELSLAVREGLARRHLEQENQRLQALTQQQNEQLQAANTQLEQRVRARTAELEQVNGMLQSAFAQLEENFLLSMDVFAGLLELRERGAAGYSRQVAQLAKAMALQLGLPSRDAQDVFVAGLLHEIGKIGLPDALLQKPFSAMSADERARYRRHPLAAEAALMPLASLQRVASLVRSQHERLDGKGFPDGLQGAEFSPVAQVLALASEYHGLLSGRLAERQHGAKEAVQMIRGRAGSHFAVPVVEAFLAVHAREQDASPQDLCISAAELRPGMVLARDLMSAQGTLLLAKGFCFDAQVVRQIHGFVQREGAKLSLYVLPEDKATAAQPALTH